MFSALISAPMALRGRVFTYRTAEISVDFLAYNPNALTLIISEESGTTPADGLLGTHSFSLEIGTGGSKEVFSIPDPGATLVHNFPSPGLSWTAGDVVAVKLLEINTAPRVANEIPNQTALVDTAFSYGFPANTFNDAGGHTLSYTATKSDGAVLPTWLGFNATTRTFSGTPQTADVATVSVKVTASDGSESISDEFDIVVRTAPTANCNVSYIDEIWSATLTVGNDRNDYGYEWPNFYGSLSDTEFTYGSVTYEVRQLSVRELAGADGLKLEFRRGAGKAVFNNNSAVVLCLGSTRFSFGSDIYIDASSSFIWVNSDAENLNWSTGDVIAVKLVTTNNAPGIRRHDAHAQHPGEHGGEHEHRRGHPRGDGCEQRRYPDLLHERPGRGLVQLQPIDAADHDEGWRDLQLRGEIQLLGDYQGRRQLRRFRYRRSDDQSHGRERAGNRAGNRALQRDGPPRTLVRQPDGRYRDRQRQHLLRSQSSLAASIISAVTALPVGCSTIARPRLE